MPLDRERGEVLDGFRGSAFAIIEARELANLTGLLTPYKNGRKVLMCTVFEDAVANAIDAFAKAGALRPIRFDEDDVLVQLYPLQHKVAVIFQRRIAGKDQYVSRYYDVPPPVVEALLGTTGKKHLVH